MISKLLHLCNVWPSDLLPEIRIQLIYRAIYDRLHCVFGCLDSHQLKLANLFLLRMINNGAQLLGQIPLMKCYMLCPVSLS